MAGWVMEAQCCQSGTLQRHQRLALVTPPAPRNPAHRCTLCSLDFPGDAAHRSASRRRCWGSSRVLRRRTARPPDESCSWLGHHSIRHRSPSQDTVETTPLRCSPPALPCRALHLSSVQTLLCPVLARTHAPALPCPAPFAVHRCPLRSKHFMPWSVAAAPPACSVDISRCFPACSAALLPSRILPGL